MSEADIMDWKQVPGFQVLAVMPGKIDELRTRKGKLMARIGEMWHIVPLPTHKQNG